MAGLELPTGIPLVYQLGPDMRPMPGAVRISTRRPSRRHRVQ
jgi:hypothetical protein